MIAIFVLLFGAILRHVIIGACKLYRINSNLGISQFESQLFHKHSCMPKPGNNASSKKQDVDASRCAALPRFLSGYGARLLTRKTRVRSLSWWSHLDRGEMLEYRVYCAMLVHVEKLQAVEIVWSAPLRRHSYPESIYDVEPHKANQVR